MAMYRATQNTDIPDLPFAQDYGGWTKEIQQLHDNYTNYANQITVFKNGMNPLLMPVPSWWGGGGWAVDHKNSMNPYTNQEALEYLNIAEKASQLKLAWKQAQCTFEKGMCDRFNIGNIQSDLSGIHALQIEVNKAISCNATYLKGASWQVNALCNPEPYADDIRDYFPQSRQETIETPTIETTTTTSLSSLALLAGALLIM